MATKPVKVLTDLLTKKQILKRDLNDNLLFQVSGTLNNGHVSSSLPVSASLVYSPNLNTRTLTEFSNFSVITSSDGKYNLDQALHAIDNTFAVLNGTDNSTKNAYKRLRYQITGAFNSEGYAEHLLPANQYGNLAFPVSSLDYFNISVMTKEENMWTNDLLAYNLVVSGSFNDEVWVKIYAPGLEEGSIYRLLAVNENPEDYVV